MQWPKTIGACVDLAFKLREERQAIAKKAEEVAKKETELKDHVLNTFKKDDIEGAKGKLATAGINRRTVAQVKDWEKFYKYISKHKAFELLQRRVNDGAYRERLEAGEVLPGVEPFQVVTLSLTKKGSK